MIKTNWYQATINVREALFALNECRRDHPFCWLEIRNNGDQVFPIQVPNPTLNDPFNWAPMYGTYASAHNLADRKYLNSTEKDLTYNWTYTYGTKAAVEKYRANREITEGLCISAGVGTPVRIEDAQMYRDIYVKDGYLYKHPGKEACIATFWTPKDGAPCYVPDPNIEKVLVICVETDPNKVTEADCIRRTVKALETYANTLDSKNVVQRPAFPSKEEVSDLRNNYPAGTRISLTKMDDIQAPPIGTKGTVKGVDDAGNILVHWDNGSGLSLAYGADECEKIDLDGENMEKKIKVGDLVFVSNPDTEYEKEFGVREHKSFFGTVTEVSEYEDETCVEVEFPQTPNGCEMTWSYDAKELSLSKELSGMTFEEISNRYGLQFFAEYL